MPGPLPDTAKASPTPNGLGTIDDALALLHSVGYITTRQIDSALKTQLLRARLPGIADALLAQPVALVQSLREQDVCKPPSIAESVDRARALLLLHAPALDEALVRAAGFAASARARGDSVSAPA